MIKGDVNIFNFIYYKSFTEFSKINNLVDLDLYEVGFTGVSPLMLKWTSLKRLYESANEFKGTSLENSNCFIF